MESIDEHEAVYRILQHNDLEPINDVLPMLAWCKSNETSCHLPVELRAGLLKVLYEKELKMKPGEGHKRTGDVTSEKTKLWSVTF